jgi:hypothetical protein
LGQSLWLDKYYPDMLNDGTLKRYIDELPVTGLTSNQTIFGLVFCSEGLQSLASISFQGSCTPASGQSEYECESAQHHKGNFHPASPRKFRPNCGISTAKPTRLNEFFLLKSCLPEDGILFRKEATMPKLTTAKKKAEPKSEFGLPEPRKYPMPDAAHARNAKARASQEEHAGNLSATEKKKIDSKADKVLKKK